MSAYDRLNERQRRFVDLYTGSDPGMAGVAEACYAAAGYKPSRQHAHRLATNGYVRAAIAERRLLAEKDAGIKRADHVRTEASRGRWSAYEAALALGIKGPMLELCRRFPYAVDGFEPKVIGTGEDAREVMTVKMANRTTANTWLAKALGWEAPKQVEATVRTIDEVLAEGGFDDA